MLTNIKLHLNYLSTGLVKSSGLSRARIIDATAPYRAAARRFRNTGLEALLTYLSTYLLNYSIQHSSSWEANRFSANQEIPRILWNPKDQ